MSSELVRSGSRAEELDSKRQELASLQAELADRELYLLDLRTRTAAFEALYLREVGTLYAELDEWNARIAELWAESADTEDARATASQARAQATESHAAAHGASAQVPPFTPSPDMKRVWREVARQIHPDNAIDDADREIRNKLMAEANEAYRRGDSDALRRILAEYQRSPESVTGSGPDDELERILRQIDRIRRRLAQIDTETSELLSSEISLLMAKVEAAAVRNRDLLAEMKTDIQRRILLAKEQYESQCGGRADEG